MPLKVGLVGCGAVSQHYYSPALTQLEKQDVLRVAALFDPNRENMGRLNQSFPGARQARDLVEFTGLDLAIIASPPEYHAGQSIQLLQSGLSILCEKPMALSFAEGEAMVLAALATHRTLAIGLFRRFFPAIQAIRGILAGEYLGEVLSVTCYEGGTFDWPVQSPTYFASHGVLMDIGVHLLDLLTWWWGQPAEVEYQDDAMGGVEVNCKIRLRFDQGFPAEVRLSRDWSLPNRYVIQCTKGWLRWEVNEAGQIQAGFNGSNFPLSSQLFHSYRIPGQDGYEVRLLSAGASTANFQNSFTRQIQNVAAAVRGEEEPAVPGKQGLESLRLIETCYRNRQLMKIPWFSDQEQRQAERLSGYQP